MSVEVGREYNYPFQDQATEPEVPSQEQPSLIERKTYGFNGRIIFMSDSNNTPLLENPFQNNSVDEIIDKVNTPLTGYSHWDQSEAQKVNTTKDQLKHLVEYLRKRGIPEDKIKQGLKTTTEKLMKKAS